MTVSAWELTKYNSTGLAFHAGAKYNNRGVVTCGLNGAAVLSHFTTSPDGVNVDPILLNPTGLDPRYYHAACVFDERLWISGGLYNPLQARSDVLCSRDGRVWEVTYDGSEGFFGHRMVAFGNPRVNLVLLGGQVNDPQGNLYMDQIVKSVDGVDYDVVNTEGTIWEGRSGFGCLVYKNRVWVFGGMGTDDQGNDVCFNDVWCSADLIHWDRVIEHAAFSARRDFGFCEWDERMWIIGGREYSARADVPKADVWFSRDGLHWEQGFDFPTSVYAPVVVPINNLIHVHGGVGNEHNVYKMRLG